MTPIHHPLFSASSLIREYYHTQLSILQVFNIENNSNIIHLTSKVCIPGPKIKGWFHRTPLELKWQDRVRGPDETIAKYVAVLRGLAEHCFYGDALSAECNRTAFNSATGQHSTALASRKGFNVSEGFGVSYLP